AVRRRAAIFADGHEAIVAVLRDRHVGDDLDVADGGHIGPPLHISNGGHIAPPPHISDGGHMGPPRHVSATWREAPMTLAGVGTDEWSAAFDVDAPGWHEYAIVAWVDRFRTWRHALEVKAAAG